LTGFARQRIIIPFCLALHCSDYFHTNGVLKELNIEKECYKM